MLIGIDGNEANVKNRVGSNEYAFELMRMIWELKGRGQGTRDKFIIYLKKEPLTDLPKETEWWQYRVIGSARLWTQWRLPLALCFHRPRPR